MRSLALLVFIIILSACTSISSKPTFKTASGAIGGYDPVAYFTEARPVKGKTKFNYEYNRASWYFTSQENKALFRRNPEKYAPQYGGYCAYAMANGFVVSSDPEAFSIINDKLYLNYSLSVRETWLKEATTYIERADKNWQDKKR